MSALGQAIVVIRGDMSQLPHDLHHAGQQIKQSLSSFSLSGVGATLAESAAGVFSGISFEKIKEKALEAWQENMRQGIELSMEAERAERRLAGALEATGFISGKTRKELIEQAEELSEKTAISIDSIVQLQTRLLFFDKIRGEVFDRATKAALEWSSAMGTDASNAAQILGRSLQNPILGMAMLRRMGIILTSTQQEQIEKFMKMNDVIKAQEVLLDAIEKKYGKFAENSVREVDKLRNTISTKLKELGDVSRTMEPLTLKAKIVEIDFQKGAVKKAQEYFSLFDFHGALGEGKMASKAAEGLGSWLVDSLIGSMMPGMFEGGRQFGAIKKELVDKPFAEQEEAKRKQEELDAKFAARARLNADAQMKKDRTEGFFDPEQFSKRMQESMFGKGDKMLAAEESQVGLLEEILTQMQEGGGMAGAALPVAKP